MTRWTGAPMTTQKSSSNSQDSVSTEQVSETPLQKGFGIPGRGYSPIAGQILPIAPSTSTGESESVPSQPVSPSEPATTPKE